MDTMNKNKWQVRLAAIIIFLLGTGAGILAPQAYNMWFRATRTHARHDRFDEMLDRLHLSGEQKAQVKQILGDAREQVHVLERESAPRYEEIKRQADERLRQVLTPDQWQQFQQMMQERHGPRRHGRKGRNRKRCAVGEQ